MAAATNYPMTRQGVRDLNQPARRAASGRVNVGSNERAASMLGGALLAGLGVGRGDLLGWLLAAAGGGLVYRGTTGHCMAYAAAGVSTAG